MNPFEGLIKIGPLYDKSVKTGNINVVTINLQFTGKPGAKFNKGPNVIDLDEVAPDEINKILDAVLKELGKSIPGFVSENTASKAPEIVHNREDKAPLIAELAEFVPSEDMPIIRAGLLLAEVDASGDHAKAKLIKNEIGQKHGPRGNRIANICRQHFLENFILPKLRVMKQMGMAPQTISDSYEYMVKESSFAIFLNNHQDYETQLRETIQRIEIWRKFGIPTFSIHAMGVNIPNAIKMLDALIGKFGKTNLTVISKDENGEGRLDVKLRIKSLDTLV